MGPNTNHAQTWPFQPQAMRCCVTNRRGAREPLNVLHTALPYQPGFPRQSGPLPSSPATEVGAQPHQSGWKPQIRGLGGDRPDRGLCGHLGNDRQDLVRQAGAVVVVHRRRLDPHRRRNRPPPPSARCPARRGSGRAPRPRAFAAAHLASHPPRTRALRSTPAGARNGTMTSTRAALFGTRIVAVAARQHRVDEALTGNRALDRRAQRAALQANTLTRPGRGAMPEARCLRSRSRACSAPPTRARPP